MSDTTPRPDALPRRSQIYRWHEALEARFESDGERCLVGDYGDTRTECEQAARLGLCDLSLVPRTGFNGAGAPAWLARHAVLPATPNAAVSQELGGVVARLSQDEFLVLDPPRLDGALVAALDAAWSRETPQRVYPLPRGDSHCAFAVAGEDAPAMLATLCAVDLRPDRFPRGALAQTSVARLNAIVLRAFTAVVPIYTVLADVSAAEYLWDCLHAGVNDAGGAAIGAEALRAVRVQT